MEPMDSKEQLSNYISGCSLDILRMQANRDVFFQIKGNPYHKFFPIGCVFGMKDKMLLFVEKKEALAALCDTRNYVTLLRQIAGKRDPGTKAVVEILCGECEISSCRYVIARKATLSKSIEAMDKGERKNNRQVPQRIATAKTG